MNLYEDIMREFIDRLKQEGTFSPVGLIELEEILNGPTEDVEADLVDLIKRENGMKN